MLMPASAEFAALCQSQITMMAGVVGADSTAVYLAEGWSDQAVPQLISIAVYPTPKSAQSTASRHDRMLPAAASSNGEPEPAQFSAADAVPMQPDPRLLSDPSYSTAWDADRTTQQRLAIPLMHEGGVFGVLVSWRADRPWQQPERDQMEECAHSLTLACVLDQRGQWLSTRMSSLDRVQAQQSDRFHELLHQLRSPLTALKTFGKLLIKRLPSEDQNQLLVANMLRESDRLQELLGYFDETLQAADDTRAAASTSAPLLLAPAVESPEEPQALLTAADSLAHFGGALDIHPGSVAALLEPLVQLNQPLAEAAEMRLQLVPPAADIWLQFDPKALGEILNNLLDNSLKYSSSETDVWLQWGLSHPDQPTLSGILLGDTGPGIPPTDQAHIFERHYRGRQAAGELDGSGLGLAIAADLMGEMRGQIEVYSPLSKLPWALPETLPTPTATIGTAFVLWLPIAAAEA